MLLLRHLLLFTYVVLLSTPLLAADVPPTVMSFVPEHDHGAPLVQVHFVNGVTGTFVFDTGTEISVISSDFMHKLPEPIASNKRKGADPSTPWYGFDQMTAQLSNGTLHISPGPLIIHFPQITIDTFTGKDAMFIPVPSAAFQGIGNDHIDGIVGANLFNSSSILIDNSHRTITWITTGKLSKSDLANYNMSDASEVKLDPVDANLRWTVKTSYVNGNKSSKEDMIVDTGSQGTYVSYKTATKLGLSTNQRQGSATLLGQLVRGSATSVDSVTMDDFTVQNFPINYSDTSTSQTPLLLGESLFAYCNVLFDFPGKRMYLKPVLPPLATHFQSIASVPSADLLAVKATVPFPDLNFADEIRFLFFDQSYSQESSEELRAKMAGDSSDAARYHDLAIIEREAGSAAQSVEDIAKSVELYKTLLKADSNNTAIMAGLACAQVEAGDLTTAEQTARAALVVDPKSAAAWDALGQCLHRKSLSLLIGQYDAPSITADDQTAFNVVVQKLKAANISTALIDSAKDLSKQAGDAFNTAVSDDPTNPFWQIHRQSFLGSDGVGIQAVAAALENNDSDPLKFMFTKEGVDEYDALIKLEPENTTLLRNAAVYELEEPFVNDEPGIDYRGSRLFTSLPRTEHDQIQAIMDHLNSLSLSEDPVKSALALDSLGVVELVVLHDQDLSIATLRHALDLNPDSDDAVRTLSLLMLNRLDYTSLEQILQGVVDKHGTSSALIYLARAQYAEGKVPKATLTSQAAYDANKEGVFPNLALAAMLMKSDNLTPQVLSRIEGCISIAEKSSGLNPGRDVERQLLLSRGYYDVLSGNLPDAEAKFMAVLHDQPTDTDALSGLGLIGQ